MKKVALVYLVAGISSRFGGKIKGFTKIDGKNLIEYSLAQALKSRFSKIIFVVGKKTERAFKKKFRNSYKGVPIYYALQRYDEKIRDRPWGTADALCSAISVLNCPFVVCNGDDIYGEDTFKVLTNHLKKEDEEATIGYRLVDVLPDKGKVNRGIIQVSGNYVKEIKDSLNIEKSNLKATSNKPDDLCAMGIFAFHPDKLKLLCSELEKFKEVHKGDKNAEAGLPDQITNLIKKMKIKMRIYPAMDKWLGLTNREDVEEVRKTLKSLNA